MDLYLSSRGVRLPYLGRSLQPSSEVTVELIQLHRTASGTGCDKAGAERQERSIMPLNGDAPDYIMDTSIRELPLECSLCPRLLFCNF